MKYIYIYNPKLYIYQLLTKSFLPPNLSSRDYNIIIYI